MLLNFSIVKPESITSEYILTILNEQYIIEYFLGSSINFDRHILSPFRKENNPSFSFKRTDSGSVIWKDWSTGKSGDCFSFVQEKYNCNFREALDIVYNNLIKKNISNIDEFKQSIKKELELRTLETKEVVTKRLIVQKMNYSTTDYNYWTVKYGIKLSTLLEYDVYPASKIWLEKNGNRTLLKYYTNKNPIYAYEFKSFDKTSYKIYSPYEVDKKRKWFFDGKSTDIEGFNQLPLNGDKIIITKSMKDVMCLHEFGFASISLQGEHNTLSQEDYEKIKKRFDTIYLLYDNDIPGIEAAKRMLRRYPTMELRVLSTKTKDVSDTIVALGIDKTKEIIKSLIC